MRKLPLIAAAIVLIAISFRAPSAVAQQSGPPTLAQIQSMIDSAGMIDPDIERYMPRWKINETDLKIKIAQWFNLEGMPVKESDSMVVIATFPKPATRDGEKEQQELLAIRVGPRASLTGTQNLRRSLGDGLYMDLVERNYAHTMIEPAVPIATQTTERIGYVMQPGMAKQFVAASAFRQVVLIGATGARLEHVIGNDEIGYQFWASGQAKGLITYPVIPLTDPELRANGVPDILTVQIGVAYRTKFGQPGDNFLGGLISPRKLNGSFGAKAVANVDYRLPQLNDIGFNIHAEVPFSKLVNGEAPVREPDIVKLIEGNPKPGTHDTSEAMYYLRTVAQGSLFWETWLNNYEHFFRVSVGASYQEFARGLVTAYKGNPPSLQVRDVIRDAKLDRAGIEYRELIHPQEVQDWLFAKIEYLNQSGFPFGLSAQLANRNLLLAGYIPVIPNWLFIEAKYSTPLLRDNPMPWEQGSFFMISPILRFKISGS